MSGFIKSSLIIAIILLAIGASLLILDIVSSMEVRDILQKTFLVLGVFVVAGWIISLLSHNKI